MIIIVVSVGDRKGRKESSQEARRELSLPLPSGDASEGRARRRGPGNRAGPGAVYRRAGFRVGDIFGWV